MLKRKIEETLVRWKNTPNHIGQGHILPAGAFGGRFWPAGPIFWDRSGTWRLRARLLVFSKCTTRGPKCRQLSGLKWLRGLPFQLFAVIDLFGFVDGLPEGNGMAVRLYFCRQ